MPHYLQVSISVRAMVRFGVSQQPCRQRPPHTPFGPTTVVDQFLRRSTSPSMMKLLVRSNTFQRTTRGPTIPTSTSDRRSSTKRLETDPHGKWPISGHTPRQEDITQALQDLASNFLSVIQCISLHQRTPEEVNCGHTTPRMGQHGWSLKSGLVSPVVGLEEVCHFWLATPCISPQMMEALSLIHI